ncbi:unnamed protein product [Danaus chrysippus]|uniref:(African queen) hypothetical protein n=1 Tax=Danaus chrysippus TaxID=151541 RepID=A0A8J2MVK4_9NEOP|nr:unnamed protein product [Danaus chrysippus]
MENIINFQEDLYERIVKAKTNFKKSPKERITKEYVDSRLENLEQLWFEFLSGHKDLFRSYNAKDVKGSSYVTKNVYDKAEEMYLEYKCDLKTLSKQFESKLIVESNEPKPKVSNRMHANYPQINIPHFSGNYQEWTTFKSLFKSLVINNECLDEIQRLHYLKCYLKGEAEQLIKHVPIEEGNFERCWLVVNERYNDKKWICHHVLKRFLSQKNLTTESSVGLKELVDTTNECLASLASLGIKVEEWDMIVIHLINLKLDPETRRQWEFHCTAKTTSDELPTYQLFVNFLKERFSAINRLSQSNKPINTTTKIKALHITKTVTCVLCKENHKINQCTQFHKASIDARRKIVTNNNLCFNCLGENHSARECHSKVKCRVCKRSHNSLLHPKGDNNGNNEASESIASSSNDTSQVVSCLASSTLTYQQVLLATALVKAVSRRGENLIIRALIDQGSQSSFITESTVQYLGLKKMSAKGRISGCEDNTWRCRWSLCRSSSAQERESSSDIFTGNRREKAKIIRT